MIRERDELITPALAKEYLDTNTGNWRPMSKKHVNRLAEDMAQGRWIEDTGSIDFTTTGELGDGQHRLAAVVQSGATIRFRVRRDVPDAVIENIDTGTPRSFANVLAHRGENQVTALGGIINLRYRWGANLLKYGSTINPSRAQLLNWFEQHADIRDTVKPAEHVRRMTRIKASVAGAFYYEAMAVDQGEADAFITQLADGDNLVSGSPILALRNQFATANNRYRTQAVDDLARIIKAWNAWITGTPMQRLTFRFGGSNPESFPDLLTPEGTVHKVRP